MAVFVEDLDRVCVELAVMDGSAPVPATGHCTMPPGPATQGSRTQHRRIHKLFGTRGWRNGVELLLGYGRHKPPHVRPRA